MYDILIKDITILPMTEEAEILVGYDLAVKGQYIEELKKDIDTAHTEAKKGYQWLRKGPIAGSHKCPYPFGCHHIQGDK